MKGLNCRGRRTSIAGVQNISALVGALLLLQGSQVFSQTVDYGALERLFAGPVTTSAAGGTQRSSKVPANMEIITAEDIRRSGARYIPGILPRFADVVHRPWGTDI